MKSFKIRYLLLILFIGFTSIIVQLFQHDSQYDNTAALETINKIPLNIMSWTGQDIHLDKSIYKILDTRAIVHRRYLSDNGERVFLSIVHYSDAKVDFHTPEGCLGGSGIEAEKKVKTINIPNIKGKQDFDIAELITDDNESKTLVYYFYKAGNFTGQNYFKMRMNIAINKLTKGDSSGSLIRISTPINIENPVGARATLISFLSALFPAIEQM